MSIRLRHLALVVALLLVLGSAGAWLFVYLGIYNVAATRQHIPIVYQLLDYAMFRSVAAEAKDLTAPKDLHEPRRIRAGVATYREQCLQCHGAPAVSPGALAFGMTPAPVNLLSAAREWESKHIFWVVKHGAKMTGMPAWEYRLTDEQIWDVVAFVKAMAAMSPGEYASLAGGRPPPPRPPLPEARVQASTSASTSAPQGDVELGRHKTAAFLCHTCHVIPGIVGAGRHVGPPLTGIGTRSFIAGVAPNSPENMVRFLLDPQAIDPQSAMPALGLNEEDARDIAAFLYTLRAVQ